MKKAVVFYFSGTGNTWWVTGRLVEQLNEVGARAACYSVEQVDTDLANSLIAECDLIGFGYPVHTSDVPEVMKHFMKALAPVNKDVFIYCTQWLFSGDGARVALEFLPETYKIKWVEHFAMPNNVSVSVFRLPYTNDKKKINKSLEKNDRKIQRFVCRIMGEKPFLRGFNPVSTCLGLMQRAPFRSIANRLRDDISTDREKCTGCGYCVKLCPSGNLVLEGKTINTRGNCIICLRCYSFCPVIAVKYMNKLHRRGNPYRGPVDGFDPAVMYRRRQS